MTKETKTITVEYKINSVWNLEEISEQNNFRLEDIESYYVKYDILEITLKNGDVFSENGVSEYFDYKYYHSLVEEK